MPDTLSKEDVQKWMNRIKLSETWREPHEDRWKRIIGYQKNIYFSEGDDDQISVNLVHPFVRVVIPAIYSKNPDVVVVPRRRDTVKKAEVMQKWLRYIMREIGLKKEVKLAILDALLCGHGWIKTGYQTDFEIIQAADLPPKTVIQKVRESMQRVGEVLGFGKPELPEESTFSMEPNERVVSERPWVRRASPFDIFVPAFSKRDDELPWIAERFVRPKVDVMENDNFIKSRRQDVKSGADALKLLRARDGSESHQNISESDEDMEYVIYYEVWDGRSNTYFTIAENNELPLKEPEDNPYDMLDTRFPYDMLRFNEVTDEFYPLSDIEPWEPQIHELNSTRTQVQRHRRRYNRRYITKEDAFTPEDLEKLKKGEDGVIAKTSEDDIQGVFWPVTDPPLPPETYASEKYVREDIANVSGITDYQRGSASAGAKTATEASIVETQSRFRQEERLDVVAGFANSVTVKIAQISQAFLPANLVFPVLGEEAVDWVQVRNRKEIAGDFLYDVVFGSSAPINRDVDREQYKEFYIISKDDPIFNPYKLRLEYLKKMDIKDPEEWLDPRVAQFLRGQNVLSSFMGPPGQSSGGNMRPASSESRVPSTASERGKIARGTTKAVRRPGGTGGRKLA